MDSSFPAAPLQPPFPEISIIIPARNEEASLGDCLTSLRTQSGVAVEIIVVDDASTDRTRTIAESFAGVRVISPEPLLQDKMAKDLAGNGWTGKNNALIVGAKQARAGWLLFTDADTFHLPGSLARALDEARTKQADLLSYSPKQVAVTFAEKAVMPVIFAELAARYPLHKVRDQTSGIVAANGQYILVRRAAYEAVGGHAAVAREILEDVALARLFRDAGQRVYFRYGGDAVRTRMYRNWSQLREGWTKNLALLFPRPEWRAIQSMFLWLLAWAGLIVAASGAASGHFLWIALTTPWLFAYRRIHTAHFTPANNLVAMAFGPPIFAYLLLRSKKAHASGRVSWKGRAYNVGASSERAPTGAEAAKPIAKIESQKLRTDS